MSEQSDNTVTSEEKRSGTNWIWGLYFGIPILLVLGSCFVGIVKFMAWWRVAFGDCTP